MPSPPLCVFDTNILMDILLGRDNSNAVLLVGIAEERKVELAVPEFVIHEFRGTALRWIRGETENVAKVRGFANEWLRCSALGGNANEIRAEAAQIEEQMVGLPTKVDEVIERIRSVAEIPSHTMELHFRGDLRFLAGRPPDRPGDGLKDCRIYEAILSIARDERNNRRDKFLVTRDSDFYGGELRSELDGLGFQIECSPGKIYAQYR